MLPKHPVYVPSRGRSNPGQTLTAKLLMRDRVPFRLVVEREEEEAYRRLAGDHVLVLPESNRGLIYARNWIRDHAEASGAAKHHQLDDNLQGVGFYRLWDGRRIPCHSGTALRVCEDFTDRYENVGLSGLNYDMFVPAKTPVPYVQNCHVYSCTLVNHAMPCRWRLAYNDDTDICLQALANGWTTLQLNVVMIKKVTTMMLAGGNTDDLYRESGEGDARDTRGRYEMARALESMWPGVVRVIRRFGRFQHSVNWGAFKTPLRLRDGVDLAALPPVDEFGMTLRTVRDVRSPRIRELLDAYPAKLAEAQPFGEHWRGLPAFLPYENPEKITATFKTEADRDALVARLGVTVDKRFAGKGWSAAYPPRGRDDPASLYFGPADQEGAPA